MVEEESLEARQISNDFQLVDSSSSLDESLVGHWSQNTFLIGQVVGTLMLQEAVFRICVFLVRIRIRILKPVHLISDPDTDTDPDPDLFVSEFQDAKK